jgi:hypothetical protein
MATARTADASQAAYFRSVLAEERVQLAGELARSRANLRACSESERAIGLRAMARVRSETRELEARSREVERLIARLDQRFPHVWLGE